jgi:hypothetical protein
MNRQTRYPPLSDTSEHIYPVIWSLWLNIHRWLSEPSTFHRYLILRNRYLQDVSRSTTFPSCYLIPLTRYLWCLTIL